MRTYLKWARREWERCCLWGSTFLLTVLIAVHLTALLPRAEGAQVRPGGAKALPSYLNPETAFAFLEPRPVPEAEPDNPFAFSVRLPKPLAAPVVPPAPVEPAPEVQAEPTTTPAAAATQAATTVSSATPAPPPAPPKRTASVLFRGLYRGGSGNVRQVAFLSTRETAGGAARTALLGEGETAAGVTLRRLSADAAVVAGPNGEEVSIGIGQQATVALE